MFYFCFNSLCDKKARKKHYAPTVLKSTKFGFKSTRMINLFTLYMQSAGPNLEEDRTALDRT